jgi:hypothetical protein
VGEKAVNDFAPFRELYHRKWYLSIRGTGRIQSLSYKLAENRRAIDDVNLRHSEMVRVLRKKDDIRVGVVEE